MIIVTFEDTSQVEYTAFTKDFPRRFELYHWLETQQEYPFTAIKIVDISGEEDE